MTQLTTPPRPGIEVRGLRKSYDDQVVLDGIDLDVPAGTVQALLGPNGAGKTTTVKILCTQTPADAGSVRVAGCNLATDPDGIRAAIGVTGQFSAVDPLMTGRENLRLMADLWHLGRAEGATRATDLLARFDLADAADKAASTYSGGMTRRLDLAMTLMSRPRVVFLDEPTTGLDPRSRRTVWEIVEELVAEGVTILLTTQYLEEADRLADRVSLLDGGRIVAEGTPAELKALVPGGHLRLDFADDAALDGALVVLGERAHRVAGGRSVDVPGDGSVVLVRDVLARLDAAGLEPETLAVRTPDLDDVFLALTGHAASPTETDTSSPKTDAETDADLEVAR